MTDGVYDCFVIAPIGEIDSNNRKNYYALFENLLEPAFETLPPIAPRGGLEILETGRIKDQVSAWIQKVDFCIADISELNPNVYYEIGLCHAYGKKIFLIKQDKSEKVAEDLAGEKYVTYDLSTVSSARNSVKELRGYIAKHIESLESKKKESTNNLSPEVIASLEEFIQCWKNNIKNDQLAPI